MSEYSGLVTAVRADYLRSYLAEESWVIRSHAAAIANGTILGSGELDTITVNVNNTSG